MSTKTGNLRRMMLSGGVATLIALGTLDAARADVTSDQAAAILIIPKLVVDTSGKLGPATDSEVQITNTSNSVVAAQCYLINTTSYCSNSPINDPIACTAETEVSGSPKCTGGVCLPPQQVEEIDFLLTLTKRQPVSWKVSEGLLNVPLSPSSAVPQAQTTPWFGQIRCVEVDPTTFKPISGFNPANNGAGDLKGEATIVSVQKDTGAVDARKYNAIGIQATGVNNGDDTLNLGGPEAEYNGCPNVLILDHLFDDANVESHVTSTSSVTGTVRTDLTITPCGIDLDTQTCNVVTLQFLVFNEFEQRFSTSTRVNCWREVQLSNIDTPPTSTDNFASIFNVNVQGTFAGQTRIRAVNDTANGVADTVVAVAEEFWQCSGGPKDPLTGETRCTTAANVHYQGTRDLGDKMILFSDFVPFP